MDVIFPIEQAMEIVEKFEKGTLPKSDWTHEAHLIVGLYHAAMFQEEAMSLMREKIKSYNEKVGTPNTISSGYHETLTYFWLWAVKQFCSKNGLIEFNQATIDDLLWTEELANRNLWLNYYSKEKMMTVEARLAFCPPDIRPLDC
jgi:hypothetical protein